MGPYKYLLVSHDAALAILMTGIIKAKEVTTVADSIAMAIPVFEKEKHEIVVVDLETPGLDGVKFVRALKKVSPNVQVIVLASASSGDAMFLVL
ncbi:MAG: response regulator, partial [Candidatus Omnitrophica bacterium]|nr:response regulator [Candidatus Omnitrophota bacterium]